MMPSIATDHDLDEALTTPRPPLLEFIRNVSSPLLVLGAGGKMGPSLAVLARRAADVAGHLIDIVAVSRFSEAKTQFWLEQRGVKTMQADLLEADDVSNLPDASDVIYLAGLKFGTAQNPSLTWAVNTLAPAHVANRYVSARVVALSTGNVYPFVPVESGGAQEDHPLIPLGEYANAAVARERIFDYFSRKNNTRMALMRLNYAVELRYGVLVDIARKVWAGEPIDVSNGWFNCIWQADANEMILRALGLATCPARAWNLTGPTVGVRQVAQQFSELLDRPVAFAGAESSTALLSNSSALNAELGPPATSLDTVISWIAQWVKAGGSCLNRPTHFEVRNGTF
ncbi:MAG: NAD-dependent epimerase/dehydratase family protein [Verrucomicrobiales bacterium]